MTATTVMTEVEDIDIKEKEERIYTEGKRLVKEGNAVELKKLIEINKPFFGLVPKARTAKIVRCIIDMMAEIPDTNEIQIQLCLDTIDWCRREKRTFLRQRIETRLAVLYLNQKKYQKGLEILKALLKEVKKLDDKLLLVEIHLIESKLHFLLLNLPKSKAALTAARARASGIHCPPLLQADIDLMAGMLHSEEGDYNTAYSYFYEAFECLHVADEKRAMQALSYMLLAKVMSADTCDVTQILSHKNAAKYQGRSIDALKALGNCHHKRSLEMFEKTVSDFKDEIEKDNLIKSHTKKLYETLLEKNLIRILEPFSRVEIQHVADLIHLPVQQVQTKLSEMILDEKFNGTLDQGSGVVIIYDEVSVPTFYQDTLLTFKQLQLTVDALCEKAAKLTT